MVTSISGSLDVFTKHQSQPAASRHGIDLLARITDKEDNSTKNYNTGQEDR